MKIKNTGAAMVLVVGVTVAMSSMMTAAQASPESEALTRQGLTQIGAGQTKDAARSFSAATQADPNDGVAFYFLGTALNRTGAHFLAMSAFRESLRLKTILKNYGFEAGWAAPICNWAKRKPPIWRLRAPQN